MRKQTFMQKYRQWKRDKTKIRASIDNFYVGKWGYDVALNLDRYDKIVHSIEFNVHTRINFRKSAKEALGINWELRSKDLNKYWGSIANL